MLHLGQFFFHDPGDIYRQAQVFPFTSEVNVFMDYLKFKISVLLLGIRDSRNLEQQ